MTVPTDSYRQVLSTPRVKSLLMAGVIGRLAYGIIPFAVVVAFAERHGFGVAGVASTVLMAAIALLGPWRGRQVDRHGPKVVLVCAAIWTAAFVLLAVFLRHIPWPAALVVVGIAGGLAPPLSPILRTGWSQLLPDKKQLQRIHSLDSIIEETTFVVAPLLTTATLTFASPAWALALGAVLPAIASPLLITFANISLGSDAVSFRKPETNAGPTPTTPSSSGRKRSLLWGREGQGTVLPIAALGTAGGGLAIVLPALAEHGGRISSAGYGFAAFSLGGVLGGLLYGRNRSQASLRSKYLAATVFLTAALLTLFVPGGTTITVVAVFLAGLAVTPLFVIGYLLVDEYFQRDRHTEANALLGSGYNLGSALGSSLAGILLTAAGVHTTLAALAIVAALGAFAVVLLPKRATGLAGDMATEGSLSGP